MIPGFVAPLPDVQDHIHLGMYRETNTSSPITTGFDASYGPPYQFRVRGRGLTRVASGSAERAINQHLNTQVYRDPVSNAPVIFQNFDLEMILTQDEVSILQALEKHHVWFVDNRHCKADADHRPYIKIYWLESLRYSEPLINDLSKDIWTATLIDDHLILSYASLLELLP